MEQKPETDGFVCENCGTNEDGVVVLCSLHAAAPELLEALKELAKHHGNRKIYELIAKAEGKE